MKKLKILFDDKCIICAKTAQYFKNSALLDSAELLPLSQALSMDLKFDRKFSQDKMACINIETKEVYYGVDSFLEILSDKHPLVKSIGKSKPIFWMLDFFYSIICYNRKIFIPMPCHSDCEVSPSKNYVSRIVLILISGFVVNFATSRYFSENLGTYFIGNKEYGDYLFFFGQIVFQFIAFKIMKQKNFYNYAGHVSFVSLLGAILMLVFYCGINVLDHLGIQTSLLSPLCYGIIFSYMFYEHSRRLKIENWTQWLSVTWFLYRLIIYPFAFKVF
jgi:hypothetical protein